MINPQIPESELLKHLLEPLLDDFRYWFERSQNLLETEKLNFMLESEQLALLTRVKEASLAVNTAVMMFNATDKQVGIEVETMLPWHQLLMECRSVGMRFRQGKTA